jgi:hypothetical protein
MGSDQRDQLLGGHQKGDGINESEQPEKNKTSDLIGRLTALNFDGLGFWFHLEHILSRT